MPYTKIAIADPQPETVEVELDTPDGPVTIEIEPPGVLLTTGHWIAPDEVAVELDTGEHVALSCVAATRDYASQTVQLKTTARVMTPTGGTMLDAGRDPAHIAVSWMHGASPGQIDAVGGLDMLRAECLRVALGEPPTMIGPEQDTMLLPLDQQLRTTASIRRAIAAAAQLAGAISSDSLL